MLTIIILKHILYRKRTIDKDEKKNYTRYLNYAIFFSKKYIIEQKW